MNVPRAMELAMAQTLRTTAELGKGAVVRAWQSLSSDPEWDKDKDKTLPVVDVRCGPPMFDDSERTMYAEISVTCGTSTADDKDHSQISALYGAVQEACDALFAQYVGTESGALSAFKAALTDELGSGFNFGGISWGENVPPSLNSGINMIGIVIRIHYSRSDF